MGHSTAAGVANGGTADTVGWVSGRRERMRRTGIDGSGIKKQQGMKLSQNALKMSAEERSREVIRVTAGGILLNTPVTLQCFGLRVSVTFVCMVCVCVLVCACRRAMQLSGCVGGSPEVEI